MPEPTQGPYDNFANDGTFPAGADPWAGQPNTVLPSVGFITRGFMAGEKFALEYLNFFLRNIYLWVAWFHSFNLGSRILNDEWVYPTAKTRTYIIPAGSFRPTSGWVWVKNRWEIPANASNNEKLMAYIDVPANQSISKVEIAVRAEESNVTASFRQRGFTTTLTASGLTEGVSDGTQVGGSTATSSGTTDQIIELNPTIAGPLPYPFAPGVRHAVRIGKGNPAGAGATYVIVGDVRVTLSDPGPRSK